MNSDSEAIDNFLAWLLQTPHASASAPSGNGSTSGTEPDPFGEQPQLHHIDSIDSEEMDALAASLSDSHFLFEEIPLFNPGDIPAVQDRFHTLIKHRLRAEIERRPPLFPWESEVRDYESQLQEIGVPVLVPTRLWLNQLHDLTLPVPMPEPVLVQLFDRCQAVIQTSLRQGVKLVQVVEKLFPGQPQVLNHVAGLVLTSPSRSGGSASALAGMPAQYEAATELQQMALSLIAAREILDSLTLTVSAERPSMERQWHTSMGQLTIQTSLSAQLNQLRIQGDLPCAGQIELKDSTTTAKAERTSAGVLSVELFDLQPDRTYPLTIQFAHQDAEPLIFAIQPVTTDTAD